MGTWKYTPPTYTIHFMSEKQPAMRILSVAPIDRGIKKEVLTYFTSRDIPQGSVISVAVRGRTVRALVLANTDARASKTALKHADFSVKNIKEGEPRQLLLPAFVRAIARAGDLSFAPVGVLVSALVPSAVLKHHPGHTDTHTENLVRKNEKDHPVPEVFQADEQTRMSAYRGIVRESFARGESVFICTPGPEDAKAMFPIVSKGIEEHAYLFHAGMSEKKLLEKWRGAEDDSHPILVAGTGQFLSLARKDIRTIIVEKEGSRAYKMMSAPFVDIKTHAESYAREIGALCIFGDSLLSVETRWKETTGEYKAFAPLVSRTPSLARIVVADMRKEREEIGGVFRAVSARLSRLIEKNTKERERLFIFVPRKGIAGITICADCGTIALCKTCEKPLRLRAGKTGNEFSCASCVRTERARDLCGACGSWRMTPLGAGADRVCAEIAKMHPDTPLFKMDADSANTPKKSLNIMNEFLATEGGVLVGTEMAISRLPASVENIATGSVDPLFFISDFRAKERAWRVLFTLRSKSGKRFLVQTHNPTHSMFSYLQDGDTQGFFEEEIKEREAFSYPPFSTLIKISRPRGLSPDIAVVAETLRSFHPTVYSSRAKNQNAFILLKVPHERIGDPALSAVLSTLPLAIRVEVNPDSIF